MLKKILVLVSNPKGTSTLDLLPEIRELREALQRSQYREIFTLEWRVAMHQSDLRRYILDVKPQILHFCGHGTEKGLVLEDNTGTAKVVPNEVLIEVLRLFSDRIECVVLNVCHSASFADELGQHLNYVIGMNQAVLDASAIAFSEGFYAALGAGESYPQAFAVGRTAVFEQGSARASYSRKIEVINEHGEPSSFPRQEHLIPSLKTNPNPTAIEPWLNPQDNVVSSVRLSTVPLQIPLLPPHFVERPAPQNAVKAELLSPVVQADTLVVSAIYGLGGIGKSVLATKLTHDEEVQTRFSDGILWVTLGQNPDILPLLSGWIQELGDYDYKPTAIQSASYHLRTLLSGKRFLLVVDDVWQPDHLEPFQVGSDKSCVLVTTREARIPNASRYDLDIMDAGQALSLMTQKLSDTLDATAREQAEAFSRRVGYLPLALELGASQIEEGFLSWQELLDDLNEEVARLESLNVYGPDDNISEGEQRKYSLLACFNLSLKRLSNEQRRQFAWLGIIHEDVSLTEAMAATLWQVNSRHARRILHSFRSKALVLAGAQQPDGRPSYRMHDLMHDLAQRLLTASETPTGLGDLPGLGLTKAEAHRHFLALHQSRTTDGQWHTLTDDGYVYNHLTWHMEQAEQPASIYRLLETSDEDGRNGWYGACDAIGKLSGFVNDVGRAWNLALNSYQREPEKNIVRLFRYLFIRASLNSMTTNVSTSLVEGLVSQNVWKPAQSVAYAQQIREPWQKTECISSIVPYLPESLLLDVLRLINRIEEPTYRSYALSELAKQLPSIWPDVLSSIRQIKDYRSSDYRLPEGFARKALALKGIAEALPTQYLPAAAEIGRHIQSDSDKTMALAALALKDSELMPEALEAALQIQDQESRSSALQKLVAVLPEYLMVRVLEAARQLGDGWDRSDVIVEVSKHSSEELLRKALEAAREIQAEISRFEALCAIAQRIPEIWPEVLESIRHIQDEESLHSAIVEVVEWLPKDLLPEALIIVRKIRKKSLLSSSLVEISKRMVTLRAEALEVALTSEDNNFKAFILREISHQMPEIWPEALEVASRIQDELRRSIALTELAKEAPETLLPEIYEATNLIWDESNQISILTAIAERVSGMWPAVLAAMSEIYYFEDTHSSTVSSVVENMQ